MVRSLTGAGNPQLEVIFVSNNLRVLVDWRGLVTDRIPDPEAHDGQIAIQVVIV